MRKAGRKIVAAYLALAMVVTAFLGYLPAADVQAAQGSRTWFTITGGANNSGGHAYGNASTAAPIFLMDTSKTVKEGDTVSVTVKPSNNWGVFYSYIDDSNWLYVGYDSSSKWYYQFSINGQGAYPGISGWSESIEGEETQLSISLSRETLTVSCNGQSQSITNQTLINFPEGGHFGVKTIGATSISFTDVKLNGEDCMGDTWDFCAQRNGQQRTETTEAMVGLTGTITDADTKAPVAGATVRVGLNSAQTDAQGKYSIESLAVGTYAMSVTKPGYDAYSEEITLEDKDVNVHDVAISVKSPLDLEKYDTLTSSSMRVYIGKEFPVVARYEMAAKEDTAKAASILPTADKSMPYTDVSSSDWFVNYVYDVYVKKLMTGLDTTTFGPNGILARAQFAIILYRMNDEPKVSYSQRFSDIYSGDWYMKAVLWAASDKIKIVTGYSDGRFGPNDNITREQMALMMYRYAKYKGYSTSNKKSLDSFPDAGQVSSYAKDAMEWCVAEGIISGQGASGEQKKLNPGGSTTRAECAAIISRFTDKYTDSPDNPDNPDKPDEPEKPADQYDSTTFFRGNENAINTVAINGVEIVPTVTVGETTSNSRTYNMHIEDAASSINMDMTVEISVAKNTLTWKVTEIKKADGCAKIATIDVPQLNLLSVDASEKNAGFAGAQISTATTAVADTYITFDDGFEPSSSGGYVYAFLQNEKLSAGLHSNSEAESDQRVIRNNGADTMSLTSAPYYYEMGDKNGQTKAASYDDYPLSELPEMKVAIGADENGDGDIDWNDGALAYRSIMNEIFDSDVMKDTVNQRIVMNFASMAPNPYLVTADNIKKVYLATDGLPQAVMLKGYGNEGHDSANSEYADIAEREGGAEDFQKLLQIAHDYNTEVGIHINAQEIYPEAASMNEAMLQKPVANGWGWLDQSVAIDKLWDLASQARWKRLVQLYDRINNTSHYSNKWPTPVKESTGTVDASKEEIQKEAVSLEDNMDFIYLDVWYQNSWETRQIAKEINSLGWRFTTEFPYESEYNMTWYHWGTDTNYGGASTKGHNSQIMRFIRNDQRDTHVLNYPDFGGTADNPLLGGYKLYGFEGWQGNQDYNYYIKQTFDENLPTKFLQHYYITDWENYGEDEECPTQNPEKQITLKNDDGDVVVVTRKQEQRSDIVIERIITLNGKKVLEDAAYLLPWIDNDDGSEKLYHWNLDGGQTTWELGDGWSDLSNVVMYELTDQGRVNEKSIAVSNGSITLDAKAATPYVIVKGAAKKELKNDFGEKNYVVDPGFNGYADGASLDSKDWSGDVADGAIAVKKAVTGDQWLAFENPSKDVEVSTKISGLTANTEYVAEVYVENNSDALASIKVNTGNKTIENGTNRSILENYVQCDMKHRSNSYASKMQRMQLSFVAEGTEATLTLGREAGQGTTYMDDIRIVKKTTGNNQADGSFKQDFENVVQGLYPFVLGSAQGVSDPVTHLSQKNEPYTQKGWNGRVVDDVISGNWSLKHHGRNTGIIYQTIPQNFRFEAGKTYVVEFDYQCGSNNAYAMITGDGTKMNQPSQFLAQALETTHVTMEVTGSSTGQTWIGLYENGGATNQGSWGQCDFILDNLVIREK